MIINEIKMLLLKRNLTLTKLAELMSKKMGKNYGRSNLSNKLRRETIPYREIKIIAEILQYEVTFIDKAAKPKKLYK